MGMTAAKPGKLFLKFVRRNISDQMHARLMLLFGRFLDSFLIFRQKFIQTFHQKPAKQKYHGCSDDQNNIFHIPSPSVHIRKHFCSALYSPSAKIVISPDSTVSGVIVTSVFPERLMPRMLIPNFLRISSSPILFPTQLSQLGHQIMAVDTNEDRINDVLPYVTNAQIGDSTNAEFLHSLGIGNFDVCFVTVSGNFQNSLETTSLLKELGAKRVVSRAERDVQAKFLLRNGADHVVYPEKQVAKWAAIRYTADHIFDYIEFDEQHAIFEVEVPEGWVGKSIGELNIRSKFGINILGIKHSGKTDVSITPDTVLSGEMTILALGEYKALQKCFRI